MEYLQLSKVYVNNIHNKAGTQALSIDGSANVTHHGTIFNKNNSVVLRGFYLNADYSTTTSPTALTNWSEINNAAQGFKPVGIANGVTVDTSNGHFSFATTGVYRVSWTIHANTGSSTRWIQADIRYRPNGGSFHSTDTYNYMQETQSTTTYTSFMRERYVNIANTGDRVLCQIASSASISIRGETDNSGDTWIYFEKIAEAV